MLFPLECLQPSLLCLSLVSSVSLVLSRLSRFPTFFHHQQIIFELCRLLLSLSLFCFFVFFFFLLKKTYFLRQVTASTLTVGHLRLFCSSKGDWLVYFSSLLPSLPLFDLTGQGCFVPSTLVPFLLYCLLLAERAFVVLVTPWASLCSTLCFLPGFLTMSLL